VRRNIVLHRAQCAEAAGQLARPISWLDRAIALGRRIQPVLRYIALPLGLFATRRVFPQMKILRVLTRWGPLICGAALGARSLLQGRKS
jgi:hypothetical protein